MAEYRAEKGKPYRIEGTDIEECPVSYIHPIATQLVQILTRKRHAHSWAGASVDESKMPARISDAVEVLEVQRILHHNAQMKAEMSQ